MFAIRATRLFDGESPALMRAPLVVVDGTRIVSVSSSTSVPAEMEVQDLGDVTLLPGLIDSHVHLSFDAGATPVDAFPTVRSAAMIVDAAGNARQALTAGITTVRDLGSRADLVPALRAESGRRDEPLPEMLFASAPITSPGGHCHFMGGGAAGVDAMREAVRRRVGQGVEVIKIMASGGTMTPGSDPLTTQFTDPELSAAIETAQEMGCPVTCHAHGRAAIAQAVRAGTNGLEHAKFWVPGGIYADQETIDAIARKRIAVCPTTGSLPGMAPPPPAVAMRQQQSAEVIGRMYRSGVLLIAGSDAGIGLAKPPHVLAYAIREMADAAGMTNLDALRAATSVAADACRLPSKGRIRPGQDADIIAVDGNPLVDLRALHDIRAVIRAGAAVGATSLGSAGCSGYGRTRCPGRMRP
jgi:imidazolonepropionase-like amidohydrolase